MTTVQQLPAPGTVLGEIDGQLLSVTGLSRREVVGLLSSVAMGLVGCGGGSPTSPGITTPPPPPPEPPAGLSSVAGTVSLPSGSALSVSSLSLKVMGQTVALGSAATFTVGVSPSAPTMAMVTDANGNGVVAAFLDSTLAGSQTITPRSTGVVLTWFALGGPFLPGNLKSQVLALLNSDPAMDTLGAVLAQRITAAPLAIVNGDAQVSAALAAAVTVLTSGAGGGASAGARLSQDGEPPTVTITPPVDQGGVSVRLDNSIVGVDITNSYQRPVKAFVYETQTKTNGTPTDISPAKLVVGPIDLGEPNALTAIGGIRALLTNSALPFKAYTIDPIPLALDGLSDETTYEVVVIGPSSTGVIPAFFGFPRYASAVAGWNGLIDDMFGRVYYVDLVYAALLELSGFGSVLPSSPNLVAAGANTKKFAGFPFSGSGVSGLPSAVAPFSQALSNSLTAILADQSLCAQYQGVAPTIMDKVQAAVLQQVNTVDWQASLKTATSFLPKVATAFSTYQGNGSINKLFKTLASADAGLLWAAVLDKQGVIITPPSPSVISGEQVPLTAVLAPDLTSTYEFDWTQSSSTATLSAVGENNVGQAINTLQTTVNLVTSPTDVPPIAPIVVSVVVYDVAHGQRALVARTSTTVDVLLKASITPFAPFLSHGNQQAFLVTYAGSLPAGVQYLWTLQGTSGSIGALSFVTTTAPSITYTAQQKGVDTLQVQIVDASNRLLAKTSTPINVDAAPSIQLVVGGNWNVATTPANGSYGFTDFQGARSPSQFGTGLDELIFVYDLAADNTVGVGLGLFVPTGQAFSAGETFSKILTGQPATAGTFQVTLSQNLNDVENSIQHTPAGTGSCRIDGLSQLIDGTFVAQYSFTIDNGAGGLITGSGVGQWT
jgi:hypothetical protein